MGEELVSAATDANANAKPSALTHTYLDLRNRVMSTKKNQRRLYN